MGIYLNPDNEGFREAIDSEIYVDKSELLTYTNKVLGTEQKNICVSRPRRFGKSMAAKMLSAYYSKGCDSKALFENKKIAASASYREHLINFTVVFLIMQRCVRGPWGLDGLGGDVGLVGGCGGGVFLGGVVSGFLLCLSVLWGFLGGGGGGGVVEPVGCWG